MNTSSLLMALFVLALFEGVAWITYRFSENHYWSERRRRLTCAGMAVMGVVAAIFVYYSDSGLRNTTLHEIVLKSNDEKSYSTIFNVESSRVEHDLLIDPLTPPFQEAAAPVELRIRLTDDAGQTLIDEVHSFEIYEDMVVHRGSGVAEKFDKWDSETYHFTPRKTGRYMLELIHVTGPDPDLHVRVADPTKTDGHRAPGY